MEKDLIKIPLFYHRESFPTFQVFDHLAFMDWGNPSHFSHFSSASFYPASGHVCCIFMDYQIHLGAVDGFLDSQQLDLGFSS